MEYERLLLEGADLIDGTGAPVVKDALVLIKGAHVEYAGPRTRQADEVPARRLDVHGKTLIPGLIEAHTHAHFDADMIAYVKNGITTIRFAGLDEPTVAKLRGRIEKHEIVGPRILSCGPMIDEPPPAYPEWSVAVRSPAEAAGAAERLIRSGEVDALIVTQRVTAPVMRAVVDTAHRHGCSVIGQTWAVDGKEAADLGIDELHNSSRVYASREYPKDRLLRYESISDRLALSGRAWATIDWDATRRIIEAMVQRQVRYCGMQVITQFQAGVGLAELENDPDFLSLFGATERQSFLRFTKRLQGTWTTEDLEHWKVANDNRMEWMRRFHAMGGDLLVGTDMQFGGIMFHRELRNMAELGLSPLQALVAATGGCARALRMETKLGAIRDGLLADIVVLNRDPLEDLTALRDIACVIKGGVVVWANAGQQLTLCGDNPSARPRATLEPAASPNRREKS
jgi:imidazolonepropionase-like amidohydrolase